MEKTEVIAMSLMFLTLLIGFNLFILSNRIKVTPEFILQPRIPFTKSHSLVLVSLAQIAASVSLSNYWYAISWGSIVFMIISMFRYRVFLRAARHYPTHTAVYDSRNQTFYLNRDWISFEHDESLKQSFLFYAVTGAEYPDMESATKYLVNENLMGNTQSVKIDDYVIKVKLHAFGNHTKWDFDFLSNAKEIYVWHKSNIWPKTTEASKEYVVLLFFKSKD